MALSEFHNPGLNPGVDTYDMNVIAQLTDEPNVDDGLTAAQLKAKFDEGGLAIQTYINGTLKTFVDGLQAGTGLADGSVTTAKLADGAVTGAKIADSTIQYGKLGAGSVGADQLKPNAVMEAKIKAGAVTSTKIADGNVTNAKLAAGAVTTGKIVDGNVTTAKLADGAVTRAKLDSAVTDDIDGKETASKYVSYTESGGTVTCDQGDHGFVPILGGIIMDNVHSVAKLSLSNGKELLTTNIRCTQTAAEGIICTFLDGSTEHIIVNDSNGITYTTKDIPAAATSTPSALGAAAVGSSAKYAKEDHVHAMPTAADVGAIPAPASPSENDILKYVSGAWVAAAGGGGGSVSPYTSAPADLGTADAGSSDDYARGDHVHAKPTLQSYGIGYAICSTATIQSAKTASLTGYTLTIGGIVSVKFANQVSSGATLNINSTGAKSIYYHGSAIASGVIKGGDTATLIYDGIVYHVISVDRDEAPVTSVNGQTGAVSLSIPSTASDVGAVAVAQGVAHAGEFVVVGSDGNITTVTMTAWQGGSY